MAPSRVHGVGVGQEGLGWISAPAGRLLIISGSTPKAHHVGALLEQSQARNSSKMPVPELELRLTSCWHVNYNPWSEQQRMVIGSILSNKSKRGVQFQCQDCALCSYRAY